MAKRIRGVAGIGLAWAVPWTMVLTGLVAVIAILRPQDIDEGEGPLEAAAVLGWVGLVSGACFGVLLALAERRRPLENLSLLRAAAWGILGSAAYPLLTGRASMVFLLCPLGAPVAVALIATARRASSRERMEPGKPVWPVSGVVLGFVRDTVGPLTAARGGSS